MTQSNFGIYADHRFAHPVVRPYSANLSSTSQDHGEANMNATAQVDFGSLETVSLEAVIADKAWPPGMRSAAQSELDNRSAAGAGDNSKSGGGPAMTPHNGGVAASHSRGKSLAANAEKRAKQAKQRDPRITSGG